jgi:hypothetical protein
VLNNQSIVYAIEKHNILGQVSFTFDTWTSKPGDPFLSVTGHYIASPVDQPHEWELRNQQLAFSPFKGHHSGANMANILIYMVDHYEICNKV